MNVGTISMLMQKSAISILFVVLLVVFFIALVSMTIALIASRSDKSEDDYDEDDEDSDDDKVDIGSIFAEADKEVKEDSVFTDSAFAEDSAFTDSAFAEDSSFADSAFAENSAFADSAFAENSAFADNAFAEDSAFADSVFADSALTENNAAEDENIGQIALSESDDSLEEAEEYYDEVGSTDELVATREQMEFVERIKQRDAEQSAVSAENSAFADSAFTDDSTYDIQAKPSQLSSEEIDASVKEAMALGEALVSGSKPGINTVADRPSRGKKKKSNIPSTDEFYWYNKRDVSEKPAYKTREMYYHYFNVPEDCIEDLLMEMYDCALVRTEEIRYIAYGIEPRPMSMKELMATSNKRLNQQKIKTPSQQDLLLIYDKWCSYVDALFEIIEMHADDYTTERIRSLLCEFGRSDVDEILEGK